MSKRGSIILSGLVFFIGFFLLLPFNDISAQPSRKIAIAVGQEPTSIDPSLASIGGDYTISDNYGEYLIYRAPNGDLKPGLAASWKMSPDGKVIEFTLRKGVKFQSGDPLTSKDVEFSYERVQAKNPTVKTRLRSIERFETIDDYRFAIHFKTPDVTFIPNRAGVPIISRTYFDRVGEDKFVREPVGTGPYKLVRYVPGEYADLELFEGYWGDKPSIKEARFYFVPEDTTRVAKLKSGEVDLIGNCPYASVKEVEKSAGLKIVKLALNHPTPSIVFANRNPNTPWHDKRVRLAMAYALDWKAMVDNVFMGLPNHWAFLAPHELGYDANLKPYPYNPKRARELLAEAGYPRGFDLNFYWAITGRWPMAREMAEAIASYFDAVGIRTKLIGEEWAATLARIRASKAPNATYVGIFGGAAGGPDPTYNMDLFFGSEGGMSVYSDPELDKLIAAGRATADDAKRAEIIKKAVRLIHDDAAGIPIYSMVAVYAMKNNIDFRPTQKHNMDLVLLKDITVR